MNIALKAVLFLLAAFLLYTSIRYESRIRALESQVEAIKNAVL